MVGLEMIPREEAVVLAEARAVMGDRTHRVETEEMAILAMGPFPVARQPTMTDLQGTGVSWATPARPAEAEAVGQPSLEVKTITRAKAALAADGAAGAAVVPPHMVQAAAETPAPAATRATPCGW